MPILDAVDLAIRPGEIVTLIGPNGSGKTTLVRALRGLVPVAAGRILRNTSRIGYVPYSFARDRRMPLTALRFLATFGAGNENAARDALARAFGLKVVGALLIVALIIIPPPPPPGPSRERPKPWQSWRR